MVSREAEAALDEGDSNADAKRKLKADTAAAAVAAMRTAWLVRATWGRAAAEPRRSPLDGRALVGSRRRSARGRARSSVQIALFSDLSKRNATVRTVRAPSILILDKKSFHDLDVGDAAHHPRECEVQRRFHAQEPAGA